METWTFRSSLGPVQISFTLGQYRTGGGTAVQAWEHEGENVTAPYAAISTNIPDGPSLPAGQFYLKDWSENSEIAQAMRADGLIERVEPQITAYSGFVTACAYQFTEQGKRYCH